MSLVTDARTMHRSAIWTASWHNVETSEPISEVPTNSDPLQELSIFARPFLSFPTDLPAGPQLLPIDSQIHDISSQQPRWVREDSFSQSAFVCKWTVVFRTIRLRTFGAASLSVHHARATPSREQSKMASEAGLRELERILARRKTPSFCTYSRVLPLFIEHLSIHEPKRLTRKLLSVYRYRSRPPPRAQHSPQGAQERQCLPEALGEALPLPGSYVAPPLSSSRT